VAEDLAECPDVRLLVRTNHEIRYGSRPDGRTTVTPLAEWYGCVDRVSVFIFDENDRYYDRWDGPALRWLSEYEVPVRDINLPDGVYTFVVWSNLGRFYSTNQPQLARGSALNDFLLRTKVPASGVLTSSFPHLHYGILTGAYVSNNSIRHALTNIIEVRPLLNRVNFSIVGVPAGDDWSITVTDTNREHNFRGTPIPGLDRYTLSTMLNRVDNSYKASMMFYRMEDETPTDITIMNDTTGEALYSGNLVNLIERVYGLVAEQRIDFERVLEFDVELNFSGRKLFSVTINGWTYVFNDSPLG
jgi:hypothetical protein